MDKIKSILNVSKQTLDAIDMLYINNIPTYNHEHKSVYHLSSGREHYRLLQFISSLYNDEILFDVGTNRCMSAIALSRNEKNKVKSFDIIRILDENPHFTNVEYILGDVTLDKELINSPFIFLDVDHDGTFEKIFYNHLKSIGWKGILLLDDIHLCEEMKEFWNSIEEEKFDITDKGHWSGTGLVNFGTINKITSNE